jgi:hypothetical protein
MFHVQKRVTSERLFRRDKTMSTEMAPQYKTYLSLYRGALCREWQPDGLVTEIDEALQCLIVDYTNEGTKQWKIVCKKRSLE